MEEIKFIKSILPKDTQAYLVGGYVRDFLMGKKSKDFDIEVFNITIDELEKILSKHGKVSVVGKLFGIIKLTKGGYDFDFSLPRKDNKHGIGHKGFRVEFDPEMTIEEAARRRDYTINSMSINIWTNEIIDPFGGRKDLQSKILRHTSEVFGEDPLRVLRGFQFAGRYDLDVDDKTAELCKDLLYDFYTLSKERIWTEFRKWAEKSSVPSKGLKFLIKTGWIEHFPEIKELIGCPQDPEWHPEGDVFEHTCEVVDKAVGSNLIVMLAGLCHDFGKPETTDFIDGRIRTPGHSSIGVEKTKKFLKRIGCPYNLSSQIQNIVKEHMVHLQNVNIKTVKRLIHRLNKASVEDLVSVIGIDHNGRGNASISWPESVIEIKDIAEDIGEEIKPLIMGRHLIELGLKPGPHFGPILKTAFEAQLDNLFTTVEGGLIFLKNEGLIKRGD